MCPSIQRSCHRSHRNYCRCRQLGCGLTALPQSHIMYGVCRLYRSDVEGPCRWVRSRLWRVGTLGGPVSRLLSPEAVMTRTEVFLRLLSSTATPNDMLELFEIVEERLVSFVICGASNGFVAQILHDSSHFGSVSRSKLVGSPLRRVNEAPDSYRDDGRSGIVTALPPLLPDEVPARRKVC